MMARLPTLEEIRAEKSRRAALRAAAPAQATTPPSMADLAQIQAHKAAAAADREGTARAHQSAVQAVVQAVAADPKSTGTLLPESITFTTDVVPVTPRAGVTLPED